MSFDILELIRLPYKIVYKDKIPIRESRASLRVHCKMSSARLHFLSEGNKFSDRVTISYGVILAIFKNATLVVNL